MPHLTSVPSGDRTRTETGERLLPHVCLHLHRQYTIKRREKEQDTDWFQGNRREQEDSVLFSGEPKRKRQKCNWFSTLLATGSLWISRGGVCLLGAHAETGVRSKPPLPLRGVHPKKSPFSRELPGHGCASVLVGLKSETAKKTFTAGIWKPFTHRLSHMPSFSGLDSQRA